MTRQYGLEDDSVVVVIGSGAGGGTVANELAQRGVDVVCPEAGNRLTLADVVNDAAVMDQKMGWHDKRLGAPLWICKTVGGTTMRWSASGTSAARRSSSSSIRSMSWWLAFMVRAGGRRGSGAADSRPIPAGVQHPRLH